MRITKYMTGPIQANTYLVAVSDTHLRNKVA